MKSKPLTTILCEGLVLSCARSGDFFALGDLPQSEKGFDEFALAAHGHFGEALKPAAGRNDE